METNFKSITNNNTYAIIEKNDGVLLSSGQIHTLDSLGELENLKQETKKKIVFILPFCLAREEKGYNTIGSEKILAMEIENEIQLTRQKVLDNIKEQLINFGDIKSNISDKEFQETVKKIQEEIQNGNINQMIFSRKFTTNFNSNNDLLLEMYKKLLQTRGQYMTFLFNTPEMSFLGATPEKHLCIENGKVIMNPIAGTIGKGDQETFFNRLINFLEDEKEIGELGMVIDEELKMMMKISNSGYIDFPLLKETGAVIHTEGELIGDIKPNIDFMEALRETLYAPTLTGGPIKSAFHQIAKYEKETRGYYGGAFGVLGEDFLDTAIVIRSAFIDKIKNTLSVRAGAGIVKDSIPENEAQETILKSKGFLGAFENEGRLNKSRFLEELTLEKKQKLNEVLETRKQRLSDFYFRSNTQELLEVEKIKNKKILFINSGDDFVFMSAYMIEKMGADVKIIDNLSFDIKNTNDYDIIVLGPGYGDINDNSDERMINLLKITNHLLENKKEVIGICLGHQAICKTLGYEIKRQQEITQGVQKEVNIFGNKKTLAFYNSFSPVLNGDNDGIEKFFDDRILSLNRENISSIQAHPESIMSIGGFEILKNMILRII